VSDEEVDTSFKSCLRFGTLTGVERAAENGTSSRDLSGTVDGEDVPRRRPRGGSHEVGPAS